MGRIIQIVAGALILCGLSVAAFYTFRIARAEFLWSAGLAELLPEASRLVPLDPKYPAAMAQAFKDATRIDEARSSLERAAALNPVDADIYLQLGLLEEEVGNVEKAERALLHAATLNNGFAPRWTLTNFYFRMQRWPKFWAWSLRSQQMVEGDLAPLFDLCHQADTGGQSISDKGILPTAKLRTAYLHYLSERGLLTEAVALATKTPATSIDAPELLLLADRLLSKRRVQEAIGIWNALTDRGAIPFPHAGSGLMNAEFAVPPTSLGFDWRVPDLRSVEYSLRGKPVGLTLTGKQPEDCELLSQWLALRPGAEYVFRFRFRTQDIANGAVPTWRVMSGSQVVALGAALASNAWSQSELSFRAPEMAAKLELRCTRQAGHSRPEGTLYLENLRLEERP